MTRRQIERLEVQSASFQATCRIQNCYPRQNQGNQSSTYVIEQKITVELFIKLINLMHMD